MARYRYRLATPADDPGLRDLLAATPMDGRIAVRFAREPSFLDAVSVEGPVVQVVVCEDTESGAIVGCGTRSIRARYVGGRPVDVGYLGDLRGAPHVRGGTLLAGAYRYLRSLHDDGQASFYLTTIAEGNNIALRALTSERCGLPTYRPMGNYQTAALPLSKTPVAHPSTRSGLEVRAAALQDVPDIVGYLQRVGAATPAFPVYRSEDFFQDRGTFRGLRPEHLRIASRDNRIVGLLGGWDQHHLKQTVVVGYRGFLRWIRPAYNAMGRIMNRPGLPTPGAPFRYVCAALPVVENNDPDVFDALLDHVRADWGGRGCEYLLVGMHEDHPLWPTVRRRATTQYTARLFGVHWGAEPPELVACASGATYLELGCL